jgi:peptide/nickel transport system ATP-binding protein
MTKLLEVEGLRTHIRLRHSTVRAVEEVSLTIMPGESVGLVGESGSGKSMTGMSIMRLLPPGGRIVAGSVKLAGQELTTLSNAEMRRIRGNEIAMVFQDPMTSLNPTMTIGDQIAEAVRVHSAVSRKECRDRAGAVLEMVGMPKVKERLRAFPHHLSGGLRQRAVIAMALACEPRLLIADEPTTALDVTIQRQILALLDDLKERLKMSVLFITHDMGVIGGRTDRVMVMYAGRIVESAETSALFSEVRHPYTQALLESIPGLDSDRSKVLYSIPGRPPDLTSESFSCRFAPRCRYAKDRCHSEDPPLGGEDPSHQYACFFPVVGPRPVSEMPSAEVSEGKEGEADSGTMLTGPETTTAAMSSIRDRGSADSAGLAGPEPLLSLDHLVKEFPVLRGPLQRQAGSVKAVSDVSMSVGGGETFGLVGESGCGKTTLGRLIVALERPDSGSVTFNGINVSMLRGARLRRERRDLQLMFQDPYASLDPRMRVEAILREPLAVQSIGTKKEQLARIRELLDEVGLPRRAMDLYPHEFSGGQRQRIGLARALTLGPRLIVADEPVSALDVSIRSQVLNLMKRLQQERDLTYVVISHDLSVVRYLADRIGVMYLGKLMEVGPADDVYERPAHPYTAGLLQSVPDPDPVMERSKDRAAVKGELPSAVNPPSGCRFRTRCPLAQEICAEEEPALRAFHVADHQAACHFPLQLALQADTVQPAAATLESSK